MEQNCKLTVKSWILIFIVSFISFQQAFVYIFPSGTFAHTGCPYNWVKYAFFDTLLLLLFPFVLRSIKNLLRERESLLMLGFFVLCALSIATHSYDTLLLPAWFFIKLLGTALLFFALVIESKGQEKQTLLKALQYTLLIAASLQAGIALIQFFTQHSLGLKFLGEGVINASKQIGSGFSVSEGNRWLLDTLFHVKRATSFVVRSQGTLDHPNHLGIFLVAGLTALTSLYLKAEKKERIVLASLFFLLFFALITTFSRASLFTWIIVLTLITLLLRKQTLPILKITLPLFLICGALFYPQIQKRGGIINSNSINQFADQERITYHNDAFAMIKAHPLNGVGLHNYVTRLGEFSTDPHSDRRPLIVHNIFLLIFSELGLPALLLFLSVWFLLLHRAWKQRSSATSVIWGAHLFSLLFYGCCDVFFLSDQQGQLTLFLVFGLAFLSSAVAQQGSDPRFGDLKQIPESRV